MFGRRASVDPRDARFPMRLLLDPFHDQFFPRGLPPGTRHYRTGKPWDQGHTSTCVEHGWRHKVEAAPIMQPLPLPHYDFYRRVVLVDPWPENDAEATAADDQLQSGTDVRSGAKVLASMGLVTTYLWASSAEDVRSWMLGGFGGVVIGVAWTADMMHTDDEGFIHYAGPVLGGHCVYLCGWSDTVTLQGRRVRAVRGMNSWSLPWGDRGTGRFWIQESDLDQLLTDGGEACAATEIKVVPR